MGHAEVVERFDTVVAVMTEDEARQCVTRINTHLNGARAELLRLYEGRGWQALGYNSWRECVEIEFGQSQRHLYRQLAAAEIEQRIDPGVKIGTIPEKHLRPLSQLTPIEQPAAWQRAVETAPNGKVTAAHVASVVEEMRAPAQPSYSALASLAEDDDDEPVEENEPDPLPVPPPPMAVHFSSATPEWYTPTSVVQRVQAVFGQIDLDPCSNGKGDAANVPARDHYTQADNGLSLPWWGKVYMNPPYGDEIGAWVARLIEQYETGEIDSAIALLPARVDTQWFAPLWDYALCFVRGRLKFSGADNSAPFPSVVVYLGLDAPAFERAFADMGRCGVLTATH